MWPALLLSLSSAGASAPDRAWIEVKVAHSRLVVVTDSDEKTGRRVALQLAQFEGSIKKRFAWIKAEDDSPLVAFAFADAAQAGSMAPEMADEDSAASSYLTTATQQVGAMGAGSNDPSDKEPSPYRGFFRGRVLRLIETSLGNAPPWLARGLATFLADAVVKDKEVLVGRMTIGRGDAALLPVPSSTDLFGDSPLTDRRFDWQAGFFIHYLLIGDRGRHAASLDDLLRKVSSNAGPADLKPALARMTSLYAGFPKYLASKKFSTLKLQLDPAIPSSALSVRRLPLAEALMLRAEVLFDLNRPVDTRGLLRQVKEADPSLARPFEMEAVLFESEQRSAESKEAIQEAIRRGSKNGSLYYRLAQLQWSRTMDKRVLGSVQKLLETARDLLPGDGNVLAYLAEIQCDQGLYAEALVHGARGAVSSPADVYAQMALARAQWNNRRTDAAQATARKALGLSKVASQRQRVGEFLTFANRNKRAQAKGGKPYPFQSGPPPAGVFGSTRSVGETSRVSVGSTQTGSADGSAIAGCFVQRDDAACARAVPALEAACAEKQGLSCVSLGSLYDGGFGVTRDRRKAAAAYKSACDLGEKPGCARLAVLEAQGLGLPRNAARALKTLESLCGEKLAEGCVGLAQLLLRTGTAKDRIRARSLLKASCDEGSAEACALLTGR
jgi:tetratricopeptide (TPR) repeat protein